MDKISEVTAATIAALARDWTLWVAIIATLLAFTLYVYFFPTPLSQPFVSGPAPAKNSIRR